MLQDVRKDLIQMLTDLSLGGESVLLPFPANDA